jgi:hypothetical protein
MHTLAGSTHTAEMVQLMEINDRLVALATAPDEPPLITSADLDLADARVDPRVLDRTAALLLPRRERQDQTLSLPQGAPLQSMLATGDPRFPHIYGIFTEPRGRRRLPVAVHTEHLHLISGILGFPRHVWGL